MSRMNESSWKKVVQEDIDWLNKVMEPGSKEEHSLEGRHILAILTWAKDNYDVIP